MEFVKLCVFFRPIFKNYATVYKSLQFAEVIFLFSENSSTSKKYVIYVTKMTFNKESLNTNSLMKFKTLIFRLKFSYLKTFNSNKDTLIVFEVAANPYQNSKLSTCNLNSGW